MTATLSAGASRMNDQAAAASEILNLGGDLPMGTSEWWLARLLNALNDRAPQLEKYDRYYNGDQPLTFASKKFRQAFGDLFVEFADNFASLVVDAVEERLNVEGFRMGSGAAEPGGADDEDPDKDGDDDLGPEGVDTDAWQIWQANQLDAESQLAHVDALVKGVAYVSVSPYKEDWIDDQTPLICVEDALQVFVETAAASRRRRRAAIKRWVDDSGLIFVNLYFPDRIEKYESTEKPSGGTVRTTSAVQWRRRRTELVDDNDNPTGSLEPWPLPNPLGVVPIIPLLNRPRITGEGRSEIDEVIPIQDGINKLVSDMMLASEFGAFPQRYAINLTLETDPDTGKPIEPFNIAVDKLLTAPPPEGGEPPVQFGQFEAADLSQYTNAIAELIQHLASITRTPAHYLMGNQGQFPSGESLRAAETGLVAKTRRRQRFFGEVWEEAIRLAFAALEDPRGEVVDSETIWGDPETRTESEHVDALVKLAALEVPLEQLWADAGYSPTQIARFKVMRVEEAALKAAIQPGPIAVAGAPGGTVPVGADPGSGAPAVTNPVPPTVPAPPDQPIGGPNG